MIHVTVDRDPQLQNTHLAVAEGHLDADGASAFWDRVSPGIDESAPWLLVDMRGVDYVSSAGVAVLTRLLIRSQKLEGSMAVYGCNHRVCALMDVVKISDVLNLRDSAEEARARLRELGAA